MTSVTFSGYDEGVFEEVANGQTNDFFFVDLSTRSTAPTSITYSGDTLQPGSIVQWTVNGSTTAATYYGYILVGASEFPAIHTATGYSYLLGSPHPDQILPVFLAPFTACYTRGTLILTNRGDVPVETLAAGDVIITATGEHRPIRWIGHRSHIGRFLAANPGVQPIRFRAGSLGNGLPRRDLLVSPEHAMVLDGLLIPARHLVNGSTIKIERGLDRVDYYHVELDAHDVLLAEGAPSESYADDGDSHRFHNAAERPEQAGLVELCAPRVESGFALEAVRHRLAGGIALVA